ncbi:HlyD family secretion protein [Parachryseolinea silvisoli]|jgi:membrane fusion protein (multidrug efflux system)|uniref:HlyD family secretion protein n=1 Tax=Parachryseolinea silvisoli TaxID=2873601 RepID=UPI002265B6F7|nr:HlyD family secretion protein [Parachryseolinea silvisoli]MCD9015815.1 HlyD family secretion protein [Parachryseolinea silvisoli]
METNKKKKNKTFAIVLGGLVIAAAAFGITKYIHGQHHEETDNAQVEADINPIIPKVSGYVTRLSVEDNQIVKEGDTLVVLDDRDLALKVLQAEAALENAKASLATSQASYATSQENVLTSRSNTEAADASIEIAQVRARRAEQDFKRYQELIKTNSVTQQQYEQAEAEKDAALKQLDVARRQREALSRETSARKAQSNVSDRNIALAQTVVKEREADLQFARLQLSYSYILAPATGVISRKSVQPGQYVQAGQSLFALVTEKEKWVVANFKETQLDKMKAGQIVEIKVDAFPGDVFSGKVESLSPATGAKFSLLPADNASGNFVKVVQRVPVKIVLTEKAEKAALLRAGMNVIVDVHLD